MGSGRSDYPNQVNNVLGFPFIFRGALDVAATEINEEMKLAAAHALADLAKQEVPQSVMDAYGGKSFTFGREYLIPKPFDYRVLLWEAPAVAEAAIRTGVARKPYSSKEDYVRELETRLSRTRQVMHVVFDRAKASPRRIIFPEGENAKIVQAAKILAEEKICRPMLIGHPAVVRSLLKTYEVPEDAVEIIDPHNPERCEELAKQLHEMRWRSGVTLSDARKLVCDPVHLGNLLVHRKEADGLISGLTMHYPDTIRPALQIHPMREGISRVIGVYALLFEDRMLFIADTTVIEDPTAEEMAEVARTAADVAITYFGVEPKVAMLSYSNFGSKRDERTNKVRRATEIVKERWPELPVDGEMQADTAVEPSIAEETYPLSVIQGDANVLVCPNLESANIAYKLLWRMGHVEAIGPILAGLAAPVHVLQRGVDVGSIVNMAAMCVLKAQKYS
ncbi:MAG TPA: hypothetical protein ENK19_05375 [Acidobacteria bacterium]|nr:hypothetical protein [Acidobacteriota bacterium]